MGSPTVIVLVIVAAGFVAWLLLRRTEKDEVVRPVAPPEPLESAEESGDAAFGDDEDELEVAVTSDGEVLIPFGHGLRIVMLEERERQLAEHSGDGGLLMLDAEERAALARSRGGSLMRAGDLTAARVSRGGADGPPFRLETLGRDGDYGFLGFESDVAARAGLVLIEKTGVVRRPLDEDGRTIPPSPEDFEEARRRYEETERELALGTDPDDPEPKPDWSNRR